jgi:serine/threonine-protein kinase
VSTELKRSKYRILGLVGQGQFGRVYCAVHRQTGRLFALKNLEQQRFPTHKFLRELRFLLSLQHPNIVTCYALEHTRTGRYLVMDYCEGGTLRSLMERDCRLSLPHSIKLVTDILEGLQHAHSRGIVHCDIKPENILLNLQSNGWVARISDFGIAKLSQEMGYQDTGNTGSPAYMAPERFYGQYSNASDIYSVGILLFELIAGHRPFSGTPSELMSAHLNRPLKLPDEIPEVWRPILSTALQKLAARRFRSAGEMLAAIQTVGRAEGIGQWSTLIATHCSFLPSLTNLKWSDFTPQQQEPQQEAIACMEAIDRTENFLPQSEPNHPGMGLYCASVHHLTFKPNKLGGFSEASLLEWETEQQIDLPFPIQNLLLRPQGCFAVTTQAVYLISAHRRLGSSLRAYMVAELNQDYVAAIEAKGRWLATVTTNPEIGRELTFWQLESTKTPVSLCTQKIKLSSKRYISRIIRLIAPDARHLAIASEITKATTNPQGEILTTETSTRFEIFNRRGDRMGSLSLPLHLEQIITTPIPYRLLATDQADPESVLIVDLKPYRVERLGVGIIPAFLAATSWGFILADTQGQIVILDEFGHRVGQIKSLPNITAIASFNHRGLLIATKEGDRGMLYTLDLKEFDLDLMF